MPFVCRGGAALLPHLDLHLPLCPAHFCLQAKDAMQHPYFNDFPERDIGEWRLEF